MFSQDLRRPSSALNVTATRYFSDRVDLTNSFITGSSSTTRISRALERFGGVAFPLSGQDRRRAPCLARGSALDRREEVAEGPPAFEDGHCPEATYPRRLARSLHPKPDGQLAGPGAPGDTLQEGPEALLRIRVEELGEIRSQHFGPVLPDALEERPARGLHPAFKGQGEMSPGKASKRAS